MGSGVSETPSSSDTSRGPRRRGADSCSRRPDDLREDRAVTPVVSNVLLVAIAIILGVTVSVFALGIVEQVGQSPPTAAFETDYTADNGLVLQHRGGDVLDVGGLSVQVGDRSYPVTDYVSSQRLNAGTDIGPLYPADAAEARLVWEQDDSSSIVYTAMPPREGTVPSYLRFDTATVQSYGSGQDYDGEFTSTTGAREAVLTNNTWKVVEFDHNVTDQTVLEFDFRSSTEGEIHGIGLENDASISDDRIFKLFGNQSWGIEYDEVDYATTDGWVHYEIPVGQLYGPSQYGQADFLALVNDIDDTDIATDSQFRNIRAYDAPDLGSSIQFEFTVEGTTTTEPVQSYGSQDKDYGVAVSDDNATLTLSNNTWASVPIDKNVTADTVLTVEFNATSKGEIHGIGLETGDSEAESRFVRFYGNQSWAQAATPYYSDGDGWVTYEIDASSLVSVGTDVSHLVFVNDDDSDVGGVSRFRNVTIYEDP
ncbi:Pilin/Flagellin, FlaG/FlaF family [Halorhabdus sp. SVX81]|uniref:type IV pilin N-terminal domain-containing protein n=1 Tax=Halorhabdus sp. SVX81 TaxID=2978283 RepID=UPI0023DBE071|nr:type IV pilin N-terminal domain-containing protein [Halorhabdus sp. SVX81]WEL18611.1 Pilin/Flagellin, FlaG/FlaF family [Halorhabdus sp. SVX81]